MSVIAMFNGPFCNAAEVISQVTEKTGYRPIADEDVVAAATRLSGLPTQKIQKAFTPKPSVFNPFTHEREKSIATLRLALSDMLHQDDLLIAGFSALLIPKTIGHVLRVCLIADVATRVANAMSADKLTEKEAQRAVLRQEEERIAWVETLTGQRDPWDAQLYDLVIPVHKAPLSETVSLIVRSTASEVVKVTDRSRAAVDDFALAARVEVALAGEGHNVQVQAADGVVSLTINRHVLLLSRLEEELKAIATRVAGVASVVTQVGKDYHQSDIYRKYDFATPSRVLLVDDEREFVQTLSERLQMRDMGSAVAYDGESALALVREDEPEVMILDLKMPGIDGIEVLRQVKSTRKEIEVIILTGHGSEKDREVCMQLGAFAYLQKPVDIDLLSQTLKQANEKIRRHKEVGP